MTGMLHLDGLLFAASVVALYNVLRVRRSRRR